MGGGGVNRCDVIGKGSGGIVSEWQLAGLEW